MNLVDSGWTRSKFVNDMTSEAIIGPAVNSRSPMSHGLMKTKPHIASRTLGWRNQPENPGRSGVVTGSAWVDSVMTCPGSDGGGGGGWYGKGTPPGRAGHPPGRVRRRSYWAAS